MAIQKITTSMGTKIINTADSTHKHTLDLKRENHWETKEIKINTNIDFAEPNLKLWILFKVIVSHPFEHEQRLCVVKLLGLDLL